jgi:glutamate/tyrosine decarboxylase-like PLP-dependent enzyme
MSALDPLVERLSAAPRREESAALIAEIGGYLARALGGIDDRLALPPGAAASLESLPAPLPETGVGASEALRRLFDWNLQAGANTAGPRCYHFVIGGATPAAHGADLLATAFDALTYTWVTSPVGVSMEVQALGWLKELFGLPAAWPGIMVTGGTMANFVGLAAGRQWWGYGARGHREIVEHCLDLARHLARRIDQAPDLALASEVVLNVVAFRYDPGGLDDARVDELNRRLGEALLRDGRVFAGTTVYDGKVAFRPAIVNWQTTEADVEGLVDVLVELLEEER